MKVTCSRCGTEYNFDDSKVTEEGVKVKCTRCDNVFRVRKKAYAITEPVQPGSVTGGAIVAPPQEEPAASAASATSATYSGTTPRQWMIRRAGGEKLEFKEMTTLQRWIVERKVGPDDEISHNGVKWKRLGNIPELSPFFKVVEDEDAAEAAKPAPRDPRTSTGEFLAAQQQDDPAAEKTERRDLRNGAAARAANEWGDDRPTRESKDPTAAERSRDRGAPKPSASRRAILGLGVVAVLGGGVYWAQFTEGGLAATAPARAWLLANTGLDLGGAGPAPSATPEATPTSTAVAVASPAESPLAPVSPVPAESPTPEATPTAVAVATPVTPLPATPAPTKVARAPDVDKLLQQGFDAYSRGRYREAINKYQAAVNADPDNSEAYALLGLAYLDSGNDDLAESSLEAAIRLNARFADAHRYLGMLYTRRGDKARAIGSFKTYLELRPSGPTSDDVRRRVASLEGG